MECPVCYESEPRCEFVCGHSFCYQCVKNWYQKGSSTCPICRASMCFRGITAAKKVWDREKFDKVLESVLNEVMNNPEDMEYGVDVIEFFHNRFNTFLDAYPDIDLEMMDYVLRTPWVELDLVSVMIFDEIPTYMRYLMVPKTSYGVKSALGVAAI
jgi:hypothetical protein